jgi:hypothetical protein
MSHLSPISAPSIPEPNATPLSLQQAVLAIKQNIEITQGTRAPQLAINPQTAAEQGINEAIYRVMNP